MWPEGRNLGVTYIALILAGDEFMVVAQYYFESAGDCRKLKVLTMAQKYIVEVEAMIRRVVASVQKDYEENPLFGLPTYVIETKKEQCYICKKFYRSLQMEYHLMRKHDYPVRHTCKYYYYTRERQTNCIGSFLSITLIFDVLTVKRNLLSYLMPLISARHFGFAGNWLKHRVEHHVFKHDGV